MQSKVENKTKEVQMEQSDSSDTPTYTFLK